jgi:hypothetical protein
MTWFSPLAPGVLAGEQTRTAVLEGVSAHRDPLKRAVNQTLDVQGFYAAIQSVFDIHQTGHGNALSVSGWPVLVNLDQMKTAIKSAN